MKILIINPLDETNLDGKKGGNQRFAEALAKNIRKHTTHTVVEKYTHFDDHKLRNIINAYIENRKINCRGYDVVISIKFPSYVIRHKNHISLINHRMRRYYDLWPEYKKSLQGAKLWGQMLARMLFHVVDSYYLKRVKRIYAQSGVIKHRLARSGIPSQVLNPPETMRGLTKGKYQYFLLPGRLYDTGKRVSLAIDAMKQVKGNVKLIITGDGGDAAALRERARSDPRIMFTGYISERKLAALYKDALAVIFIPVAEDYGLVAVEAMKCAKPVITCTDSGGPTELIKNRRNGFICPPRPDRIASCMTYFAKNKAAAKRMGAQAYADTQSINWKDYIRKILQP